MFQDRILLISGIMESFGYTILRNFLIINIQEIRIFSRDKLEQDDLKEFQSGE